MLHVGLTGNIASGKTNARRVFAELGAHAIDTDEIAHELLAPMGEVCRHVVENFGEGIVDEDGTINRRRLGSIVFGDPEKRRLLNSLVHPAVRAEVQRRISDLETSYSSGIIIIDAALMVETGSYRNYDRLVVVYCEPALQLDRLLRRGGLTLEEAKARIASQMPVEEKLKVADYRINTSGTFGQTREQIEAVYRDLVLFEIAQRGAGRIV
jgi:dephospho-CoA kinase